MATHEEIWLPLVDEPIGSIVGEIQRENPEIEALVDSPRKLLAFRTFAYIRVGILLGRLLVEHDVKPPDDSSTTWAEQLLQDPQHREQVVREVRVVAKEIAADPAYTNDLPVGPDEQERARFIEFAKRRLAADS
ncbi:MAG TPA: hypothetical protein VHQ98_11375 [Gaiellaceae bacterium]|jgi:hypothetical protein|nr:hypothetical protein [Gaiellaceae bacterium]